MKLRQAAAWPEAAAAQADIPLFAMKSADLAVLAGRKHSLLIKLRQAAAHPDAAAAQADMPLLAMKAVGLTVSAGREVPSARGAEASSSPS